MHSKGYLTTILALQATRWPMSNNIFSATSDNNDFLENAVFGGYDVKHNSVSGNFPLYIGPFS